MKRPVLQGWLYGGLFGALFLVGCMESSKQCTCPHCACQTPVMQSRMRDAAGTPTDSTKAVNSTASKPADSTKAVNSTASKPADSTKAVNSTASKPADKPSTLTKADPPKTLPKAKAPLSVKPADSVASKPAPKPVPAPAPLAPMKVVDVKADKALPPPAPVAADKGPPPALVAADNAPPLVPVSVVVSRTEAPRTTLVDSDSGKACAHAPDYTWLVGELQFSHVRKAWRIRYAPVDEEDRYGGSVTFVDTGALPMTNYQNGQIIRVEGRLRDPEAREPSPAYIVKSIQVLR